jgi:hypothetical protein
MAVDELFLLFAFWALVAAALASLSIWSPRRLPAKLAALGATALLLPLTYASLAGLLSRPKPATLEWAQAQAAEAAVLGASIREGEGIYLWLQFPGIPEPRAYVLPWDRKLAQQLQEARRQAERNGSGLAMRMPFERSWDDREPKFYALPQPALPPKDLYAPPEEHRHPSTET